MAAVPPVLLHDDNSTQGAGVRCSEGDWTRVDLGCINTYKVDSQIFATMITSGVAGLLCLAAFCVLQSFISVYRGRLLSPHVAIKPPVYTGKGIGKYFYWFWATVSMKEKELLATAGMDALMFERLIVFGLQLMAPLTIVSCSTLIPIHAASNYLTHSTQQFQRSNLMGLTMSNLQPGSKVLWVHFGLVWLYCMYAMWLLNQHYKWYVLLRQQYMTRGDSISTWLGHMPKQQLLGLRDSSVLAQSPTQQQLLNPSWGFARCRPSELLQQGANKQQSQAELTKAAAGGTADGASGVYSNVWAHSPDEQQRIKTAEDIRAADIEMAGRGQPLQQHQHVTSSSISPKAAGGPFASPAAGTGAAAAAVLCEAGCTEQGSTASTSPADSRLTSRQSSAKALLPGGGLLKSSSQHLHSASSMPEQQGRRGSSWGLFSSGLKKGKTHQGGNAGHGDVSFSCEEGLPGQHAPGVGNSGDVAAGAADISRSTRSSNTGAAGRLRQLGSFRWHGFGRRPSATGVLGPAQQAAHQQQLQHEWRQQQLQRRQQAAAEAAAAAAAAEKLGADVDWWAFKTGDPLLDRHVVDVDVAADLAWADVAGPEPNRLQRWWELAPPDAATYSSSGTAVAAAAAAAAGDAAAADDHAPLSPSAPGQAAGSAAASNIVPVPGTCLLFDRRSLRARKPSVRFRNTVHVQGARGSLLPLHVSNYAVLVTDVPGGDGAAAGKEDEDEEEQSHNKPGCLVKMLQASLWNWPCLLSESDLTELACNWNSHSFRSNKSMQFSESMRQLIQQHQQREEEEDERREQGSATSATGASSAAWGFEATPEQQQMPSRQQQANAGSCGSSDQQHQQQHMSDRQRLVEQTFRQLFPDDLHAVIPVRNFQAVDELLRQWNQDLQAYIQGRALLQLRLEKTARQSTAEGQQQGHVAQLESFTAATGDNAAAASARTGSSNSTAGEQHRPAAAEGLSVRTQSLPENCEDVCGSEVRSAALLSCSAGDVQLRVSGLDEPCRTPRLAPLKPRPVLPEKIMSQPRLVSKDEEEGSTQLGRCCAAFVARLLGSEEDQKVEEAGKDDCAAVAERLEVQRQALVDLEASILEAQKQILAGADSGSFVVLFKTPAAATLAARSSVFPQSSHSLEAFKVQPAPSPEDMLWQSMWKPPAVRRDESLRCLFWYAILYLVPTGIFTAALNSISYGLCNSQDLGVKMDWFCQTKFLQFLFTVILPMVLLMLWQNAVIPANLYKLELRRAAAVSLSEMERNILLIYVGWELVNLFLGGVLSASLTSQIKMLADNPDQWALLLGAAFPNSSNFFLNYVITRAGMMNLFRLIMPHGGMWRWIGQMLFTGAASFKHAATERYRSFIIYPASIRYGREPGLILLILLMGVAYCVAAPLITPFVLAYLCTAYLVWRYQMIYVCVRCYESGGKMWPVYFLIILWSMGLFVVFTSCIFIFKHANLQGVLVLPLLPVMYMFARYCRYSYSSRVEHPPLWLAHEAPRTEIDPLIYTPSALQPHAQGWYFEMGKAWVRWGVPAYVDPSL